MILSCFIQEWSDHLSGAVTTLASVQICVESEMLKGETIFLMCLVDFLFVCVTADVRTAFVARKPEDFHTFFYIGKHFFWEYIIDLLSFLRFSEQDKD